MTENLTIRLQADVDNAVKEVQQAGKELEKIKPAGQEAATGIDAVEKAADKVEKTTRRAKKPIEDVGTAAVRTGQAAEKGAAGVKKLEQANANALPTLTNIGRVIQDAPFGIIGIANNIDPLIESFNRLKTQSGGASGALKSVFAGLAGPAGIAIGVSAATSALIAFGPQISRAISGLSAFQNTLIEADFAGAEAFSKAKTEFRALIDIVNDGTLSINRQQNAFEQANSALSKYGLQVENLAAFQQQGARIGQIYAAIKREEAKASFLAEKAAEEYAKRISITSKLQQGDALGVLGDFRLSDQLATIFGAGQAGFAQGFANSLRDAFAAEKAFNDAIDQSNGNIQDLIKQLDAVPGVSEKFKGAKDRAAQSTANATKTQEQELQVKKAVLGITNDEIAALKALAVQADKVAKKNAQKNIEQLQARAANAIAAPVNATEGRGPADAAIQANNAILAVQNQLATTLENNQILAAGLADQFGNIFSAIASGQNAFDVIKDSLKQLVIQLIRAIVQAAILKAITGAIGGGSFGSSFIGKALISGLGGGRAAGGPVMPGMSYIVGESGAERFVPSVPGSIVPNAPMGGGQQLEFVISGNTLRTIQARAQSSFNRVGG